MADLEKPVLRVAAVGGRLEPEFEQGLTVEVVTEEVLSEHEKFVEGAKATLNEALARLESLPINKTYSEAIIVLVRHPCSAGHKEPAFRVFVSEDMPYTLAAGILQAVQLDMLDLGSGESFQDQFPEDDEEEDDGTDPAS